MRVMKTLASSRSIVGNNAGTGHFPSLKERLLGGPEIISFRKRRRLASIGFQHLVSVRRGGVGPLTCVSADEKAEPQNAAVENQDASKLEPELDIPAGNDLNVSYQHLYADQSKTVHVKFQLQKECSFGEQFLIVGDDRSFGSWDVSNAIPLDWSDGHQWAAELEVAVGKTIQFKFLLKGKTGNVVWQPGPDRTFQSWETTNTIIVSEDWDSAESQVLTEEEQIFNQNEDSPIIPEKLIVAENLAYPNDELVHNTNREPQVGHIDTSIAQKPLVETHKELIDGSNISASEEIAGDISPSEESAKAIVAENISYPNESFTDNPNNEAIGKVYNNSNGETDSNTKITEDILKDNGKDAAVKNLESTDVKESLSNYGVPILVPGLPPTPTISKDAALQDEVKKDVSIDGLNESEGHRIPEINEKQDPYIVAEQEMEMKKSYYEADYEEDNFQRESRQETDTEKIDNHSDFNDNILQNDITWGHKTLLKFFTNLRLL